MKKETATLSGLGFEIQRKKMKNMRIRVTGDKRVCVSAPHYLTENRIIAFVAQHEAYINERLSSVETKRRRCYPGFYESGDGFSLAGQRYKLLIVRDEKPFAGLDGSELVLCVPLGQSAKTLFARYMTRAAKTVFSQRLEVLQKIISPAPPGQIKLSVRNMLTRWGSINTKRLNLSLSVHLLRCETDLIDYVIMHELCHLKTPSHSRAFYKALEAYYPNRSELDKRLEEYGLVDF